MKLSREDIWKYTKHLLTSRNIEINDEVEKLAQKYINNELNLSELKKLIEKGFGIK